MKDPIRFRLAHVNEAASLAVMSLNFVEQGLGWSWTPARIARKIRSSDAVVVVAICRGQLAGFAVMRFVQEEAYLELLAIKPPYRRRGIGRRLIRWLEKSALVAGTPIIYLELRANNRSALAFYKKLGYRQIDLISGYYQGRESAIRMGRDLWSSTSIDAS